MSTEHTFSIADRRILRRAEVEAKTGFKRAHIYNLMNDGKNRIVLSVPGISTEEDRNRSINYLQGIGLCLLSISRRNFSCTVTLITRRA